MNCRTRTLSLIGSVLLLLGSAGAQEEPAGSSPEAAAGSDGPLEVGVSESTMVRLVLIDVVVVDGRGRTVADLTREDFEVVALGKPVPVDTLDIACPAGGMDDPEAVRDPSRRTALPSAGNARRIVLTFDYLHMNQFQREAAFDQARSLVAKGQRGDEIMLAALTGGLRVEQTFTGDSETVLRSLKRMRYDISLWNGHFFHMNEHGFLDGMTGLFDVLGTVPGPKGVVLYSGMQDVPLDTQFDRLAAIASVSRCSLFPVDLRGLTTPIDSLGLQQPGAG